MLRIRRLVAESGQREDPIAPMAPALTEQVTQPPADAMSEVEIEVIIGNRAALSNRDRLQQADLNRRSEDGHERHGNQGYIERPREGVRCSFNFFG